MRTGLIALGGEIPDLVRLRPRLRHFVPDLKFDWVVAVDRGAELLKQLDIIPDELVGDFDSISNLNDYLSRWPSVKSARFPAEKDVTDSEIAISAAMRQNLDRTLVIGGFGGRVDHMLGSLFLTARDVELLMLDTENVAQVIEGPFRRVLRRSEILGKYLSIVPISDVVEGVTIEGVKYPLDRAQIGFSETLGISNELIEEKGMLEIASGKAVLVFSNDKQ